MKFTKLKAQNVLCIVFVCLSLNGISKEKSSTAKYINNMQVSYFSVRERMTKTNISLNNTLYEPASSLYTTYEGSLNWFKKVNTLGSVVYSQEDRQIMNYAFMLSFKHIGFSYTSGRLRGSIAANPEYPSNDWSLFYNPVNLTDYTLDNESKSYYLYWSIWNMFNFGAYYRTSTVPTDMEVEYQYDNGYYESSRYLKYTDPNASYKFYGLRYTTNTEFLSAWNADFNRLTGLLINGMNFGMASVTASDYGDDIIRQETGLTIPVSSGNYFEASIFADLGLLYKIPIKKT